MSKYRILKFNGDDAYSYAIFYAKSVKGRSSPINWHPQPIVCGMSYKQAVYHKEKMEQDDKNKSIQK
ncbi:MAG: hypothetical protein DRO67_00025 [Candidatus Asgardarchaeum californiense]|nr:MAG: hypothetical protein DRO67_00025 [Candidatus Asgardarchaeum californiense]